MEPDGTVKLWLKDERVRLAIYETGNVFLDGAVWFKHDGAVAFHEMMTKRLKPLAD
jgi:hypothetical protein